jgi:hypothetical protein
MARDQPPLSKEGFVSYHLCSPLSRLCHGLYGQNGLHQAAVSNVLHRGTLCAKIPNYERRKYHEEVNLRPPISPCHQPHTRSQASPRGLRQADVAHTLGVCRTMISGTEVFERRADLLETHLIARACGLRLSDLEPLLEDGGTDARK